MDEEQSLPIEILIYLLSVISLYTSNYITVAFIVHTSAFYLNIFKNGLEINHAVINFKALTELKLTHS